MLKLLSELIRKDMRQFTADRRALLISFAVPIAIASFMGSLFGNSSSNKPVEKITVLVVDQDHSQVTKSVFNKLSSSQILKPKRADLAAAMESVRSGKTGVAVIYPEGFGATAQSALIGGPHPSLRTLVDPAHAIEEQAVRGEVTKATMESVVGTVSSGTGGLPFDWHTERQAAADSDSWSGVAHAFAGMAVQGLLFWAIESAMGIMRERKLGIWNRLRAAPVPASTLLLGRLLSASLRAMMILIAVLGFGMAFFGIRVHGSWTGLILLGVCAGLMSAAFGMFVAALGKTEAQSRGLTVLAVLTMTMLGGAWFPSFLMPKWVQAISMAIPVRYAVDGFDGMTWRGGGFAVAATDAGYLLLFTLVFATVAFRRFRFEAE